MGEKLAHTSERIVCMPASAIKIVPAAVVSSPRACENDAEYLLPSANAGTLFPAIVVVAPVEPSTARRSVESPTIKLLPHSPLVSMWTPNGPRSRAAVPEPASTHAPTVLPPVRVVVVPSRDTARTAKLSESTTYTNEPSALRVTAVGDLNMAVTPTPSTKPAVVLPASVDT